MRMLSICYLSKDCCSLVISGAPEMYHLTNWRKINDKQTSRCKHQAAYKLKIYLTFDC